MSQPTIKSAPWGIAEAIPPKIRHQLAGYSDCAAQLLYNRGLTDSGPAEAFLHPDYDSALHDPFLLSGMTQAVAEINAAIADKQRIVIHGDYDADGITSTVLLYETLTRLGADVDWFVPDRYAEGYGVAAVTLAKLQQAGADLVITVDCGISSAGAIAEARAAGLKVIVTDHHTPPSELPSAEAIINPQLAGDQYPNKALTGVGVAFKLAQALLQDHPQCEQRTKWLLDLVAIGTLADVGELTGENRVLVRYGLVVAQQLRRPGLQALCTAAGIKGDALNAERIGFTIAPRLNAAGRMAHAKEAVSLLLAESDEVAKQLATNLEKLNRDRQASTVTAVLEAGRQFDPQDPPPIIMVHGPWLHGIVGLVAARLAGQFGRPALAIADGEEISRGSARSIPGLDITAILSSQAELLTAFGGHPGAAGFSLPTSRLDDFQAALLTAAQDFTAPAPTRTAEAALPTNSTENTDLLDFLALLGPFGQGNPEPLFQLTGILRGVTVMGKQGDHLKLRVDCSGRTACLVGFGLAARQAELTIGNSLTALVRLGDSWWQDRRRAEVYLEDFQTD